MNITKQHMIFLDLGQSSIEGTELELDMCAKEVAKQKVGGYLFTFVGAITDKLCTYSLF